MSFTPSRFRSTLGRSWYWAAAVPLAGVGLVATGPTPAGIPVLYLAAVTPQLARIDLREHRLPNAFTMPGILIGVNAWVVESVALHRVDVTPLVAGVGGGVVLFALSFLGGMGLGDVKLGFALGFAAWIPQVALLSPAIACVAGGIASTVVLATRGRGARMAFGPYLLGGFWLAVAVTAITGA